MRKIIKKKLLQDSSLITPVIIILPWWSIPTQPLHPPGQPTTHHQVMYSLEHVSGTTWPHRTAISEPQLGKHEHSPGGTALSKITIVLTTSLATSCISILMLNTLGKIFSRRHTEIFFLFFPEKQVLILFPLVVTFFTSADNLSKQFGPRSGPTKWSDLDPNCLTLWWYSWKIFFKKLI